LYDHLRASSAVSPSPSCADIAAATTPLPGSVMVGAEATSESSVRRSMTLSPRPARSEFAPVFGTPPANTTKSTDVAFGSVSAGAVTVDGASGLPAASASDTAGAYATAGAVPAGAAVSVTSMTAPAPASVNGADASGWITHVPVPTSTRIEAGAAPPTVQSDIDTGPWRPSLNVTMTRVGVSRAAEAIVGG